MSTKDELNAWLGNCKKCSFLVKYIIEKYMSYGMKLLFFN